jgi:DNA-directed RNA polymerase alpha subunit
MRKLERRDQAIAEAEKRKSLATSPELTIADLELGTRTEKVLAGAGLKTVGDIMAKLEQGDAMLTNLRGFGLKSLATLKKTLRSRGFTLPGDEAPAEVEEVEEEAEADSSEAAD